MKPLRGRSLGTKLSEVEYARVEAAALKAGVGLSEWCRRAVLEFAERDGSQPAEKVVLAELLSLRSVLLSVVFQMSKGQPVSEEEILGIIIVIAGELSWVQMVFPPALPLIPLTRFPGFAWMIAVGLTLPRRL